MSKPKNVENQALKLIMTMGTEGILQRDLWKQIGISSREGSRLTLKLETKDLIRRERELSNSRWTYRIFSKRKPLEIDSLLNIPCILCKDNYKCEMGGDLTSNNCKMLTNWLLFNN